MPSKPFPTHNTEDAHLNTHYLSEFPEQHRHIYEFASISAHAASLSIFLILAFSRFPLVRSSRSARRHLLTAVFALLHPPMALNKNPLAWHSSRAFMTCSQPVLTCVSGGRVLSFYVRQCVPELSSVCRGGCMMAQLDLCSFENNQLFN
jgi:hypothetical protein